jgi:hypothetical protein
MLREMDIDGIEYKIGRYNFATQIEIEDRAIKLEIDEVRKTAVPVTLAGTVKMLELLASIKYWTFKGCDAEGELLKEGSVLPITEANVKKLPLKHGKKLMKIASEINSINEDEEKN